MTRFIIGHAMHYATDGHQSSSLSAPYQFSWQIVMYYHSLSRLVPYSMDLSLVMMMRHGHDSYESLICGSLFMRIGCIIRVIWMVLVNMHRYSLNCQLGNPVVSLLWHDRAAIMMPWVLKCIIHHPCSYDACVYLCNNIMSA